MSKVTALKGSAMAHQEGGQHYKVFKIQPCVLMLTLSGPAAHIAGYLVRTKGEDDLEKARHWCQLAQELGMQGWVPALIPAEEDKQPGQMPKAISVTEWCWHNNIPANSYVAAALLALEDGDYVACETYIDYMIEERDNV